ncbi:MAG: inositol monophosphatase family protein [Gammaproteobacteria bacterium]
MHPLVNIAVKAARRAGKIITRSLEHLDSLEIQEKTPHDFVTETDRLVEEDIIASIREVYPDHAILGEEGGKIGQSEVVWIIDPIDGTANYMRGIPLFAISIAIQIKGVVQHAVIFDPLGGELFTATRGSGAYLNNRRLRVSKQNKLEDSLILLGFPYNQPENLSRQHKIIDELFPHVAGLRVLGTATIALAYTAAGRFDGMILARLKEWDMAAGALLITEAGGICCDYQGQELYPNGEIIAGNPKMIKILLKVVQEAMK